MTMLSVSRVVLAAVSMVAVVGGPTAHLSAQDGAAVQGGPVQAAIVAAVRARMGDVQVHVTEVRTDVTGQEGLTAAPDPGARTGRVMQFTLRAGGSRAGGSGADGSAGSGAGSRRVGSAVALVRVSAPHVRAAQALDRDERIVAESLAAQEGDVVDVRLERLPGLDDLVNNQTRRAVAPGEVLTTAVVAVPDVVRSGDEVRVVVRMGPVEASGVGRASGSGRVGDVIRVGRSGARTLQRARIVAPGTVEILQ
jgi:flagella basal body P-ring formation protein FlgA